MLALSATIRKQYLVPRYRNKVFITSMLIGTCVNIVSNAIFIPVYDALGAVYGTLIAEFTIVFIQYMMTKKELEYTPFFKDIISFGIIGGTMYVGVRFAANVFGAAFNEKNEVVHIGIEDINDIKLLQGLKYVQSRLGNLFADVWKYLEKDRLVLFTGTPCQVAGLKSLLNREYENCCGQPFL